MKRKSQPQRVCVGCNDMKEKGQLLRVVLTPEGEIHVDRTGKQAGRGAYLCPTEECFSAAYKARRLERSLKHSVTADLYEGLRNELTHETDETH